MVKFGLEYHGSRPIRSDLAWECLELVEGDKDLSEKPWFVLSWSRVIGFGQGGDGVFQGRSISV